VLYFGDIHSFSSGLHANSCGCPKEYNLADHAIDLIQTSDEPRLDQLQSALQAYSKAGAPPAALQQTSTHDAAPDLQLDVLPAAAGFGMQLYHLSKREALYVWRNKPALIASIVAPTVGATLPPLPTSLAASHRMHRTLIPCRPAAFGCGSFSTCCLRASSRTRAT
jgi:hypothetical protein